MLGGFCSTFRRKGYVFDAATHFYPLLGNPSTLTGKITKDIGCETEWIKMDPVDQFHLPGCKPFAVPADFAPMSNGSRNGSPRRPRTSMPTSLNFARPTCMACSITSKA